MVKRLERQKIQTAFNNMREAGDQVVRVLHLRLSRARRRRRWTTTIDYAIELDPDFANFYPAVPYPGTALYDKCVREGLLRRSDADWSRMEYSYYLLRGNGLDERVVMDAINRAKRRFFLRPGYIARHLGDVVRLALTKQAIVWQVLSRTLFGARTVDTDAVSARGAASRARRRA